MCFFGNNNGSTGETISDFLYVSPECDRSKEEVQYIARRVELFRSFPLLALDPILVDQTRGG